MQVMFFHAVSLRFGYGPQKWLVDVGNRLADRGIEVKIVTTSSTVDLEGRANHREIEGKLSGGVSYSELSYIKAPYSWSPVPTGLLGPYVRDADVIYFADSFAFQDIYVLLNKLLYRKPVVYGSHAPLHQQHRLHDLYLRQATVRLLRFFDVLHVLNNDDRDYLARFFKKEIFVIPHGIDTDKFRPEEASAKSDMFRVLFAGNLNQQKGVDLFPAVLERLNSVSGLKDRLLFTICGDGNLRGTAIDLARKYPNVEYLGYRDDIHSIYRESDLFFAPSRWETLLMTLVEAQASGLPVVSSSISGPRDIVLSDRQGLLTDVDNVDAYVEAIAHYYRMWERDYESYREISRQCRESATERFAWESVIERFISMLEGVALA